MFCIPSSTGSLSLITGDEEWKSPCQTWHNKGHGFGFEPEKFISGLQSSCAAAEWLILSAGSPEAQVYQTIEKQMAQFQCFFKVSLTWHIG